MLELEKKENSFFNCYYEGANEKTGIKVICILDNLCVRYMVSKDGKHYTKHASPDNKKELCLKNATKALNK